MLQSDPKPYVALPQLSLSGDEEDTDPILPYRSRRSSSRSWLIFALVLSIMANTLFAIRLFSYSNTEGQVMKSKYAGLARELSIPYLVETPFNSPNETIADEAWNAVDYNDGMVAVSDAWAEEMGLPHSQRFPWDKSKGIYILGAHHSMHCVKEIYLAISDLRNNRPLRRPWGHLLHCVDLMRQNTLCNADDTPLYSVKGSAKVETGADQVRQCRDFTQLNDWAKQRSACYRYLPETNGQSNQIDRYKFCPEGSPYRNLYENHPHHRQVGQQQEQE